MASSSDQTAPSSPHLKSEPTFSDALTRCSTPPSSPPGFPWEQEEKEVDAPCKKPAPPTRPTTLNAFSVLGKRKPLEETTPNPRPKKQIALNTKQNAAAQASQMQLSLGQETRTKCTACGMEYVKSSSEDRNLHQKYHRQNLEGYDVGDTFVESTLPHRRMKGLRSDDAIIEVESFDLHHRKRRAHAALEIVQRELGAVEIPHDDIWKHTDLSATDFTHREPRYRSYMYIRGKKCIGYLLVERLEQAFAVLNPAAAPSADPATRAETNKQESEHQPIKKISALAALRARKERLAQDLLTSAAQPIQLADVESPAVLGITRIWTSFTHRGQNIAPTLLDAAVKYHNDFVAHAREPVPQLENVPAETHAVLFPPYEKPAIVRREQVAFSQPTEAGARLARRWVGKAYGWLVYV